MAVEIKKVLSVKEQKALKQFDDNDMVLYKKTGTNSTALSKYGLIKNRNDIIILKKVGQNV